MTILTNVSRAGENAEQRAIPDRFTTAPYQMRRVVLESPFSGEVEANIAYARACLRDCLLRAEAPIASHLLLTQPGVLDDTNPDERAQGINAGHAWIPHADALVVYWDRGISEGMKAGIAAAEVLGVVVEYRTLGSEVQR